MSILEIIALVLILGFTINTIILFKYIPYVYNPEIISKTKFDRIMYDFFDKITKQRKHMFPIQKLLIKECVYVSGMFITIIIYSIKHG